MGATRTQVRGIRCRGIIILMSYIGRFRPWQPFVLTRYGRIRNVPDHLVLGISKEPTLTQWARAKTLPPTAQLR